MLTADFIYYKRKRRLKEGGTAVLSRRARTYTCLSDIPYIILQAGADFSVPYPCLYRPFKVRIQTVRYWLFGTPAGYAGKEAAD